MNTNFHSPGKSIELVTANDGTFAVDSGVIIAIHPDGSDCIVEVREPMGSKKFNIPGVTAATIAALDPCFIYVTPVDKDDVVGTAYYINYGVFKRISANTVTARTNANAIIYLNKAFAEERVYTTETYAELVSETAGIGVGGVTIARNITARAGGGQGSATSLTAEFNAVSTVATALDSAKLAGPNYMVVANDGANILAIYPVTGGSIDGKAVNAYVQLAPGSVAQFWETTTGNWQSDIDKGITLNGPTSAKGGIRILAADNTGNTFLTITQAAQSAAATMTIPDTNGNSSFVMTSAAQTIGGTKSFTGDVNAVDVDLGASGTAGSLDVFPSTAAKGRLKIVAADNTGDTVTTITNAAQGATATLTIPNTNGNSAFVMTAGVASQLITVPTTFGGAVVSTLQLDTQAGIHDAGVNTYYPHFPTGSPETFNANGTATMGCYLTKVAAGSPGAKVLTLPNGTVNGQRKKVLCTDVATAVFSISGTFNGGTSIALDDAGDFAELMWASSSWRILQLGNSVDGVTEPVLS